MSSSKDNSITHWVPSSSDGDDVNALCLGTGRFLRSVLVPALVGTGLRPALIQARGRTFLEYMNDTGGDGCYEVDTVQVDGSVVTDKIPCYGAFSLGTDTDKEALVDWLPKVKEG